MIRMCMWLSYMQLVKSVINTRTIPKPPKLLGFRDFSFLGFTVAFIVLSPLSDRFLEGIWRALLCLLALFCLFFLLKEPHDGIRRINLRGIIQMRVDVSRRTDVAMSQPLLNVFQRNAVCVKQTGTTVSKIMEADSSHSMLLKEVRESCCQIFRLHQFSEFVHEDVVLVLLAVTVSAQSLIRSLLVLQGIQCFFKGLNDRQRSERGFGLGTILRNDRGFAVQTSLCNHMTNSKDFPFKVNGMASLFIPSLKTRSHTVAFERGCFFLQP